MDTEAPYVSNMSSNHINISVTDIKAMSSIMDRFKGKEFVLYGGTEEFLQKLEERGVVTIWYTTRYDDSVMPPRQIFTKLWQMLKETPAIVSDKVLVIVGIGYASGMRIEVLVNRILSLPAIDPHAIILHGYPDYVPSASTMKETYTTLDMPKVEGIPDTGCIVDRKDSKVVYLRDLAQIFKIPISIPIPLPSGYVSNPTMPLAARLPYLHLVSRLRETMKVAVNDMPIDVLDTSNTKRRMDYDPNQYTSAVHWGQRKLLLSEIELLMDVYTRMKTSDSRPSILIVYVGAAPGSHLPYLIDMFIGLMDIKMHLWDRPSRFDVKDGPNVSIVPADMADPTMVGETEGFFTDVVVQKYLDRYGSSNNIVFISDIRDRATEEAVLADMRLQEGWVKTLTPYACYLKFRPPYMGDTGLTYLAGTIRTQVWSRVKSSETRLLAFRPYTDTTYSINDYDKSMAYLNTIVRMSSFNISRITQNILGASIAPHLPEEGLCTCHDCAREVQVVCRYMKTANMAPTKDTIESLIRANTIASRPIGDVSNRRTLWNKVVPRIGPSERNIVLYFKDLPTDPFEQEMQKVWMDTITSKGILEKETNTTKVVSGDLTDIRIASNSKMLIYADGLTYQQIADMLLAPHSWPSIQDILNGDRRSIVVDFHRDFLPSYDASKDSGTQGVSRYDTFVQNLAISKDPDVHKQFLLFVVSQ